ncbi:LysM peptidoglycan-binding domain-containing protein [Blastococcus mobilis]|uniref:LysM domain-containing protein n=1 Tax=Blastococcus mobilis TaxID=1938746 RepID=A0A238X887_9ACTN|nr:LysM peptidoglycan-binding domain-containing protein [Blastococcus mobilis]SNR54753.1 LysM domain-containing protein [Blastococcus mobilis]
MGSVQQAVLEFDEEIPAPWRPRLVPSPEVGQGFALAVPARRSPSRVGVCRPPASAAGREATTRRVGGRPAVRATSPGARPAARPPARRRSASAPTANARLPLTRRARRLVGVLLLATGVALGSWLEPFVGGDGDLRLAGGSSVVVQPGDTLWSIASALPGDGDVRALIDEIQELNGLSGADVRPGQVLLLP